MPRVRIPRAPAAAAVAVSAAAVFAACGSGGDGGGSGVADAGPRPVAPSTAGLPPKLAANAKDADRIVGEGTGDFERRFEALRGHPVVVNQWASWCDPCRFEFPFLRAMVAKYGNRVGFIGIDLQDDRDAAEEFLRETPGGFPSVFDPDGDVTASLGGGQASPTTFFYDEKGEQVSIKIGAYATAELLDEDIRRNLLGEGG